MCKTSENRHLVSGDLRRLSVCIKPLRIDTLFQVI